QTAGKKTGHAGFLRVIAVVVVEYDHDRQLVLLANSQSCQSWIIIERAVADQAKDGPLGKCCLRSKVSAGAGAEPADATGKKRARLQDVQVAMDRKPVRDGFFHH